jgi:hypothetical protein
MRRVSEALHDLPLRQQLDLLLGLWSYLALQARNEQRALPDGFVSEQQWQLEQLAVATDFVTSPPDLEYEAWRRRLQQQLADPPPDDD